MNRDMALTRMASNLVKAINKDLFRIQRAANTLGKNTNGWDGIAALRVVAKDIAELADYIENPK